MSGPYIKRTKMSGHYIVFEGSDGSGKSTLSRQVYGQLQERFGKSRVLYTHHPGSTTLGAALRKVIEHFDIPLSERVEQLLFASAHIDFIERTLKPALADDLIVIADRSHAISTYAYGTASGRSLEELDQVVRLSADTPKIDLLFLCACPFEETKNRLWQEIVDGHPQDCRIEARGDEYLRRVADVYRAVAHDEFDFIKDGHDYTTNFLPIRERILAQVRRRYPYRFYVDTSTRSVPESTEFVMKGLDAYFSERKISTIP